MIVLFVVIAIIALIIIYFAHYLLFQTIVLFFGLNNQALVAALRAAFIVLPVSFIAASILINKYSHALIRMVYTVTAVWLGWLFYAFLACLILYLILYLGKLCGVSVNAKLTAIVLLAAAGLTVVYGLSSARNIKINQLEITLPNLPAAWKNKTAVFISDLHLGEIINRAWASRLAGKIKGLEPDLLLIGGDFFDGQSQVDLKGLAKEFSIISAPQGKYFVTGNHEEFGDNAPFIQAISAAGIVPLDNRLVDLNGLQLIGVDYKTAYYKKDFQTLLDNLNINRSAPSILLRHVPDKIKIAAEAGISLVLCGHAHKGQLFPIEYLEILLYNGYHYGLKKSGQTTVYTSSGAGVWGPPLRVLARPEIVRITFK